MAERIDLPSGQNPEVTNEFLSSASHSGAAEIALQILEQFSQIEVRKIQLPKDNKYTCWYVSIKGFPKLPIINLTLQQNSGLNIEFRYMQFVDPLARDRLQWQTNNWVYARISPRAFSIGQVIEMMYDYVPKAIKANSEGLLKQRGGTSAAETVIADILDKLYETDYLHGVRPEWLRNEEGNLLELDFLIEKDSVAIEVQGPQHSLDLYGKEKELQRRKENDRFKVTKCMTKGTSLIWMESQGIQRSLARLSFAIQMQKIRQLIQLAKANHVCHINWVNPHVDPILIRNQV